MICGAGILNYEQGIFQSAKAGKFENSRIFPTLLSIFVTFYNSVSIYEYTYYKTTRPRRPFVTRHTGHKIESFLVRQQAGLKVGPPVRPTPSPAERCKKISEIVINQPKNISNRKQTVDTRWFSKMAKQSNKVFLDSSNFYKAASGKIHVFLSHCTYIQYILLASTVKDELIFIDDLSRNTAYSYVFFVFGHMYQLRCPVTPPPAKKYFLYVIPCFLIFATMSAEQSK